MPIERRCSVRPNRAANNELRWAYLFAPAITLVLCTFAAKGNDSAGTIQGKSLPQITVLGRAQAANEKTGLPEPGILQREIVRQSFLLAAREELGLTTRDVLLGESFPKSCAGAIIFVEAVPAREKDPFLVKISRQKGDELELLAELEIPDLNKTEEFPLHSGMTARFQSFNYSKLLKVAEEFSRNRFPEVIRRAGWQAGDRRKTSNDPIPAKIEGRLAQMAFTEQFAALRDLHAAVRSSGESPELLGGLVRGYANLGLLTEFHWTSGHKVLKARALLYAQRMTARDRRSPWGLWHRAYAEAVAGLHREALADLAEAQKTWEESDTSTKASLRPVYRPEWVELIDAYCRFDSDRLLAFSSREPTGPLASLLAFLIVRDSNCTRLIVKTGQSVLKTIPECYRVYDIMCGVGGVSHLHKATLLGQRVFTQAFLPRLEKMANLPDGVQTLLDQRVVGDGFGTEIKATQALIDSEENGHDRNECSWSLLGKMVRDIRFTQVWRRLDFMAYKWSVSVDQFLETSKPLVANHPYREFLSTFRVNPNRDRQGFERLLDSLEIADPELTEFPIVVALRKIDAQKAQALQERMIRLSDGVYQDMVKRCIIKQGRESFAYLLRLESPHAPYGVAVFIETNWPTAQTQAENWEKQFQREPLVLRMLGYQYSQLRRWQDAERCLKHSVEITGDHYDYENLAKIYKAQGDTQRWKETLDEYLKQEDFGLDHARVRVEIAKHLMSHKEWEKAQPYAEAAAHTWAHWAMLCASECYEGMEDWEKSEQWIRRAAERYSSASISWFLWCKRTGRGDLQKAEQRANRYILRLGDRTTIADLDQIACFQLLAKKPAQALETYDKLLAQNQRLMLFHFFKALVADELQKTDLRDAALKSLLDQKTPWERLAALFREALANHANLDGKAVQEWQITLSPKQRAESCYFVGRFLQLHGKVEESLTYYDQCATSPEADYLFRTLAASALRERGAEPGKLKPK